MDPIIVPTCEILGKVAGVFRKCKHSLKIKSSSTQKNSQKVHKKLQWVLTNDTMSLIIMTRCHFCN